MASLSTLSYSTPQAEPSSERERLILEHLPQVRWVATRIHEKLPDSTSLEDLISIGIVGLINAIDNFDPQFNVKLKTYAEHKIRGAILDSIRGMDGIPAHKRKNLKHIQATIGALEQRLQRAPRKKKLRPSWESVCRPIRKRCWNCAASAWVAWMQLRNARMRAA